MNDNNTERHSLGLLSERWIRSAYKMSKNVNIHQKNEYTNHKWWTDLVSMLKHTGYLAPITLYAVYKVKKSGSQWRSTNQNHSNKWNEVYPTNEDI